METYSPKPDVEKDVVLFVAEKIGGSETAQEEEVQEIQWLTYEEAMKRITYNNSREILKKVWNDMKK